MQRVLTPKHKWHGIRHSADEGQEHKMCSWYGTRSVDRCVNKVCIHPAPCTNHQDTQPGTESSAELEVTDR